MPVYVDSNASGDNNGTSWTHAYVSITSTYTVAAGTEIWIASNHSESDATITLNFTNTTQTNPVRLISVNSSTDNYSTGALITATGTFNLNSAIFVQGMHFISNGLMYVGNFATGRVLNLYDCNLEATNTGGGYTPLRYLALNYYSGCEINIINCTLTFSTTGTGEIISYFQGGCNVNIINPTIVGGAKKTILVGQGFSASYTNIAKLTIENADLSNVTKLLNVGECVYLHLKRCKLNASLTPATDYDYMSEILIENSDDGTISVPPIGLYLYRTYYGEVRGVATNYRTDGASDGETPYSFQMVGSTNCIEATNNHIVTPNLTRWVIGGTEITATIYLASDTSLNNDDVWIEAIGPDNTASPNQTALGYNYNTRITLRDSPTALTSDGSSTWNGSGVTNKYKISFTYTPTESGPLSIKVFLAKPSTTIYVDPKVEVV